MDIVINNIKINYIKNEIGSKTNIIFLHGWGANINSFMPVINEVSKKYNVYAIDLPGFGLSDEPSKDYMVEDYSKIVLEFINKLKLDNVVLIGHSFGGRVIIKLVGALKFIPKKIILIDSAGIRPKRSLKYYIKVYSYKFARNMLKLILGKKKSYKIIEKYRSKIGSQDYKNASLTMREVFKNTVNEDLKKYLSSISAPTLLVWGENDTDTPLSDGKIMEKMIKDSGLVILKGAGHYSYLDNYNQFIRVLYKFLEECD